ncbi:hypothetical protein [Knoellia aerolata]|uniref:GTPase n=1 Tax=Knoellia aerolata DSM 18566 TaxID=1385519 RepID=A0A0A0JVT1_9MICO|nr:hypothetical protein [Knoellia aerolata]KGN41490.1 hypothetical protein N801_07180 [Knoellia aerolata DSM 18566]
MADIVEVLGVYDADGGVRGEVSYVVGHLLGRVECALCDVTHSLVRRKSRWDAMVSRLPVPVRLVHRNEVTAAERTAWSDVGLPVVLAATPIGGHHVLLDRADLAALDGSVEAFDAALRDALVAATDAP